VAEAHFSLDKIFKVVVNTKQSFRNEWSLVVGDRLY
jgi:hypothetical protein